MSRFYIACNLSGFFGEETDSDYDSDMETVVKNIRAEINTPEFEDWLIDKEANDCTICIIDFEQPNSVFLYVEIERKMFIKQYAKEGK